MFHIRLEIKFGEKMNDSDIKSARLIAADMDKIACLAHNMHDLNVRNFFRSVPNFDRAERNIRRVSDLLDLAYLEFENLQECYSAQFEFLNGDCIPPFDFSEQAQLAHEASLSIMDAHYWLDLAQKRLKKARNGEINGRLPELHCPIFGGCAG